MTTLGEDDFERLAKIVDSRIEKHARSDDHIALRAMVTREKRQGEIWDKVKAFIVGSLILAAIIWVGDLVIDALHHKPPSHGG